MYILKNRRNLSEDDKMSQISEFFLKGYTYEKYYWEFVQILRKFSIILLSSFLRSKKEIGYYVLILIIIIFLFIHIYNQPYQLQICNRLETFSLISCFITYYSIIYYLRVISEETKTFFLVFILMSNIVFLCQWGKQYSKILKKKTLSVVEDISKKLIALKNFSQPTSLRQFLTGRSERENVVSSKRKVNFK